jgi:hypothetical protein
MTTLDLIIEKHDGMLWGRIEGKGKFMPTPYGETKTALLKNLKQLIKDYQGHEGKEDKFWKKVDTKFMILHISYDLQAFFEEFDFLKQSKIAELAGINPGLLRQYASGVKYPSPEQAKKIEDAIHQLAKELKAVSLYAA